MAFIRVPIYNVTIEKIQEVLNDYTTVSIYSKTRNISADNVFISPNIHSDYIDPDWCAGVDAAARFVELSTNDPISGYDYLNYGGEEGEIAIPEIYFSSIIGKGFSSDFGNVECLPTTLEGLQFLLDNDFIPAIIVPPDLTIADTYISESITESRMLVDSMQSPMLRAGADNALNISDLGVKVGLDYPNGVATKNAKFAYKISLSYGDLPREMPVTIVENNVEVIKKKKLWYLIPIGLSSTLPFIFSHPDLANAIRNDKFWDYMFGPLKKVWTHLKTGFRVLSDKAKSLVTTGNGELPLLTNVLFELAIVAAIVLVTNQIWKWSQVNISAKVKEGIYQYKNMIQGMYTFNDIKNTKYQIGFGKLYTGNENFISTFISKNDTLHEYIIPLNATIFPDEIVQTNIISNKNYANFKFFPKCTQYDLMTPPPIITFTIELVAISNCVLSSTKPTAFTVSIAPDKYIVPVFDIITPSGRASVAKQDVYINSDLVFENAKFVDFLAVLDLEANGFYLPTYGNKYINSDGGEMSVQNKNLPISGNNITATGHDIFLAYTQLIGGFEVNVYAGISDYDVRFMQEAQGNLLYNPTFRLERKSDDINDDTFILQKFWNYDSSWEIRDGAIYRDTASNQVNGLYQYVPKLRVETNADVGQYYFLEIDFVKTSGSYIEIELTYTFRYALYAWYSNDPYYSHKSRERGIIGDPDYVPLGMSIVNTISPYSQRLRIENSGTYRVLLRTSNPVNRVFSVVPSEDFTGRVNYISLQFMPTLKINDGRGAVDAITEYNQKNKRLQLHWRRSYNGDKNIILIFATTGINTVVYIMFTPNIDEVSVYTTTITWGDGSSNDVITDMVYQEYYITHTFLLQGDYTVTIKNSIPFANWHNLFETFTCNEATLVSYKDVEGLMANGSVDLNNSGVGGNTYYINTTNDYLTPLYSLNINNTPITGSCDALVVVTGYLNISYTPITGDLSSLFNIPHVDASSTNIKTSFASSIPIGIDGNKTIIWKDCGMNVQQLYNLIHSIDLSNIEEGYLDIKGDNPIITDQDTLNTITMLTTILGEPDGLGGIGREWTILYNASSYALTVNNGTISIPSQEVNFGYIYNNNTISGVGGNSITSSDDWIVGRGAANNYEWGQLQIYSGNVASKFLTTGSNEYGFNGKLSGNRDSSGVFDGYGCAFLTLNVPLGSANIVVWIGGYGSGFDYGDSFDTAYPIRFVKSSTTLTHGQTGTYIGNDGRIYPTICINTQEWMSCNLVETELRDHTTIPTITDNLLWTANLGGLAKCAFDNDEGNVFI